MLKLTIFSKMKEIHCHLLQTHSTVNWGRGEGCALTPRQLRELQLGVCLCSTKYFFWSKTGKKKKNPDGKAKNGQKVLLNKYSQIRRKILKPCFWSLKYFFSDNFTVCLYTVQLQARARRTSTPWCSSSCSVPLPSRWKYYNSKLRTRFLNITLETKFSILIWTG